jgi:hypothetical protein
VAYHGCFSAADEIEQIDDLGAVQQAEGVLAVEELDAQVVEGLVDQEEVERWCGPCDSGRSRSLQVAPWYDLRAVCGEEHMSLAVISADGDHQDGLLLDDEVRWYELHDLRGKGRHSCG